MMLRHRPLVALWRVVFEAASPLSIGTGRGDSVRDMELARDANGLPLLPASSLAGVMRSACLDDAAAACRARQLFGYADGQRGAVSGLAISHGHIHDSRDCPVLGRTDRAASDPLLAPLLGRQATLRARVRLDHRGVADDTGLFERTVLPAGHRFSVELMLTSAEAKDHAKDAEWLETLMTTLGLRLGGATRSGLGRLRLERGYRKRFDLRQPADLSAWAALSHAIDSTAGLDKWDLPGNAAASAPTGMAVLRVKLQPEAGFRFGGGGASLQDNAPSKLPNDMPVSEQRVVWNGNAGKLTSTRRPLVPGTGVKGPLAHRTAYHANRLAERWAEDLLAEQGAAARRRGEPPPKHLAYDKAQDNDTVRRLFGWTPAARASTVASASVADAGRAGVLTWSDVVLERSAVKVQPQTHNSIDRFTGGVREGVLFTTENLYTASDDACPLLAFDVTVNLRLARDAGVKAGDWLAFERAMDDLCQGRLALGADSAGGQGFFTGCWSWASGQRPSSEEPERPAQERPATGETMS